MRHSQKAKMIFCTCMLAVGIFSAMIIYKTFRPSPGKPFEEITVQQALEYMEFEENYIICDAGSEEEYLAGHVKGAVNIPYESLDYSVMEKFQDLQQQIYLYSRDKKTSDKAAMKLYEMGYMNVTDVGTLDEWLGYPEMIEFSLEEQDESETELLIIKEN